MKIGFITKALLLLSVGFTCLIGTLYIVYLACNSVISTETNTHSYESFSTSNSNDVSYSGNLCAECGGQCPTNTEVHLIDVNMYSYYLCGSSACIKSHNTKVEQIDGNQEYKMGGDGRVYETNPCGLCNGSGIEKVNNSLGVEARTCPMCGGRGYRNY